MQELFVTRELSFEKMADSGKVGDSEEMWPQEILDLFFSQHPYLADLESTPVFKETNPERGYGVGVIVVKKKPEVMPKDVDASDVTKEIKFPFVIKDKSVSQLDIFIVGETFHPASEQNIQAALFRPDLFDIVRTMPGDVSMVNQLYPPYRSRYGFGTSFEGGAGGKFASVDFSKISMLEQLNGIVSPSDLARLLQAVNEDPAIKEASEGKTVLATVLKKISMDDTNIHKLVDVRRHAVDPDVLQFTRDGGSVKVKFANSQMWAPQEEVFTLKEAAEMLPASQRSQFMATGSITVSTEPTVNGTSRAPEAVSIKTSGVYGIKSGSSSDTSNATVYSKVIDFDTTELPVQVALFHDGSWAMQDKLAGIPYTEAPNSGLNGRAKVKDYISGEAFPKLGMVIFASADLATLPVNLRSMKNSDGMTVLHGTTSMEQPIDLIPTEGIKRIEKLGQSRYAIPASLDVIPLANMVKCSEDPGAYVKVATLNSSVQIISDGTTFGFRGHPSLLKLGQDQTSFLNHQDALFLSAGFGMSIKQATASLQKAATAGMVTVQGVRPIVTDSEKIALALTTYIQPIADQLSAVRVLLVKEAAILPGEETVDRVLSLNFITPENVSIFVKNLPAFQNTASELAKLLVASRLGLEAVPEGAVQRAMNALQGVIEALLQLKYSSPVNKA
jgi:hypothetical protein